MRPYGPAALRWRVGAVFLVHGAQKLFGLLGGPGIAGDGAHCLELHYPHGFTLAAGLIPGRGHEGEFHLVLIGALFCLLLGGPEAWSLDERRSQHLEAQARGRARMRRV